tara:strand:- start:31029 stop:31820 length:792 start_codon:yes stop_codon:yes gene_type:complete
MSKILKKYNYLKKSIQDIKNKLKKKKITSFLNNIFNFFSSIENFAYTFITFSLLFLFVFITLVLLKELFGVDIKNFVFLLFLPFLINIPFLFTPFFHLYRNFILIRIFNKKEQFLIKKFNIFYEHKNISEYTIFEDILYNINYQDVINYKNDIIKITNSLSFEKFNSVNPKKNKDEIKNNIISDKCYVFLRYIIERLFKCYEEKLITKEELIDEVDYYIKGLNISDKETLRKIYFQLQEKTEQDKLFSVQNLKDFKLKEKIAF